MSVSPNSTAHSLVERYRSYAEAVVNRLMKSLGVPRSLYDELVGAAYLGLVEASERFDVKRGSEFKPYAFMRIRGAVIDCMRQNSYFSGRAYRYIKVLHGINDYQQLVTAAEEGSVKNAADELATIIDFAASGAIAFQLSLDEQDSDVSRLHPGPVNPEKVFEEKQTEAILREIIATLEPRE